MTGVGGRVVVITGAAAGFGRACASACLAAGAKVVAIDQSWTGVEPIGSETVGSAARLLILDMDTARDANIDRAYMETVDHFGTIDALVHSAMLFPADLFPPTGHVDALEAKDADWERCYAAHVITPLKVMRRFARPMLNKKRGSIVIVASHHALDRTAPHRASMAARIAMGFSLAAEIQQRNVAVNIVVPDEGSAEAGITTILDLAARDAAGLTGKMFDQRQTMAETVRAT